MGQLQVERTQQDATLKNKKKIEIKIYHPGPIKQLLNSL
jgi:hypothetical protein